MVAANPDERMTGWRGRAVSLRRRKLAAIRLNEVQVRKVQHPV